MFWFHELHFLSVAFLIGSIKCQIVESERCCNGGFPMYTDTEPPLLQIPLIRGCIHKRD